MTSGVELTPLPIGFERFHHADQHCQMGNLAWEVLTDWLVDSLGRRDA